jgi:hypothetical protein
MEGKFEHRNQIFTKTQESERNQMRSTGYFSSLSDGLTGRSRMHSGSERATAVQHL